MKIYIVVEMESIPNVIIDSWNDYPFIGGEVDRISHIKSGYTTREEARENVNHSYASNYWDELSIEEQNKMLDSVIFELDIKVK